ncbi:MAG: type IV pilus twitching motility protein PilT [Firmicutes bacterium]|nr:type IV pilus twitching motility protein PilT [Bacillota bacterium]
MKKDVPDIDLLLQKSAKEGASDLHLTTGLPPMIRLCGELRPFDEAVPGRMSGNGGNVLTAEDTALLAEQMMGETEKAVFRNVGEVDFSHVAAGGIRVRANVYRQRGDTAAALRIIPETVPEIGDLGLPAIISRMCGCRKGLFLVTGPAGCGKSTTLAAMVGRINSKFRRHIITLEDPIEYIHEARKSMINQREIGLDSTSFSGALRAALRQDPDVIMVGEMRDLETISVAVTAAETGHLVLASMHTVDAPQTIERIIDVFPPYQQQQIRVQLAGTLLGVVAQKLLRRRDGEGLVVAAEVLIANTAIRNHIREGKIFQIYSMIQTGGRQGMQLMDADLLRLYRQGKISLDAAVENAADPEGIMARVQE